MTREVEFLNANGVTLAGSLELPPGRVRGVALFAHCFTCTAQSHGARRVSMALAEKGIATLRFDFTGLGKSEGAFADSHFAANVGDLVAAAEHLNQTIGVPGILIGHSLGGPAVIAAAEHIPGAKAVVTIAAPFDPAHALHQLDQASAARIEAERAAYAASIIAAWVDPFLGPAQEPDALPEGCVRVASGEGPFVQLIDASGHSFLADEPVGAGGGNLGPTPYDLLLAALGTCTAMTIEIVARAENIPVEGVSVLLRHERRHADDSAAAMGGRPRLEVLHRAISLEGDLTPEQRDRMLVIANKCPVHRTIESGPAIETVLID